MNTHIVRPATQRNVVAISGAMLVILLMAAVAILVRSPRLTTAIAGALLLMAGFVVMAPCQLQMAATLMVVVKNMAKQREAATGANQVRQAAFLFALGYLTFYVPIALCLSLLAWLFGRHAWILTIVGGLLSLVLGLSALGIIRHTFLARCRGPLWLVRTGRASFNKPFRAGIAFGQYCATCCGPYIYALVVLAGGTASFWLSSGLVMLYAFTMVIPFLLPVILKPDAYASISTRLQSLSPRIGLATAYMLVGLGVLLIPVAILIRG